MCLKGKVYMLCDNGCLDMQQPFIFRLLIRRLLKLY
jgi:hypothetical protein